MEDEDVSVGRRVVIEEKVVEVGPRVVVGEGVVDRSPRTRRAHAEVLLLPFGASDTNLYPRGHVTLTCSQAWSFPSSERLTVAPAHHTHTQRKYTQALESFATYWRHTCIVVCTCTYVHMRVYLHVHAHTHAHAHAQTQTHAHALAQAHADARTLFAEEERVAVVGGVDRAQARTSYC